MPYGVGPTGPTSTSWRQTWPCMGRRARKAIRYTEKTLETSPSHFGAIYVTSRSVDFARNDFAAARARYAFHYPDLLAPEPPEYRTDEFGPAISLAAILLRTNESERARMLLDRAERAIGSVRVWESPATGSTTCGSMRCAGTRPGRSRHCARPSRKAGAVRCGAPSSCSISHSTR